MSGPDQDDADKSFLARWSQRKQEAKQPEPRADVPEAEACPAPEPVAANESEPEFDLSSLPKLEEMTSTTDLTGFLRKGVPEHLRNAALRKSWALDPAILNYVDPALEYAYDWNTPGGVPGSSEIGAGLDVARMVSQIMGGGPAIEPAGDPARSAEPGAVQEPPPDLPGQALRRTDANISTAQEPVNAEEDASPEGGPAAITEGDKSVASQQTVRRHGSAKPVV
jgi:hypothetical protein